MHVFLLTHTHVLPTGDQDEKLIGIYSSEPNARAAIDRLSAEPGFAGSIDGFQVDTYEVDQDHWVDGFGAEPSSGWTVVRQDDNGNEVEMATGLTEESAKKMVEEFTSRGHKQIYWAKDSRNSAA